MLCKPGVPVLLNTGHTLHVCDVLPTTCDCVCLGVSLWVVSQCTACVQQGGIWDCV